MSRRRVRRVITVMTYLGLMAWSISVVGIVSPRRHITVLCSSIEQVCREWSAEFTRLTHTEVRLVRMPTGEALARLSRPGSAADFDVWHGGPADSYEVAKQRGLLSPYRSPEAEAVPAEAKDPAGYWSGVYLGVLGFCSNEEVLRRLGLAVPTSWDDLLHPQLRGLVSVPSARTSGTGYAVVWSNRVRLGSDARAVDYLRKLHANVLQYTASGIAPARVAGRGEAAVAVTFSQHCIQAYDSGSSALKVSYPRDGTTVEVGSVAIVAGARDELAARAYVDYALSRGAQSLGAQLPTRKDLPADPRLGSTAVLLASSAEDAAAARSTLTDLVVTQVYR